jgi:sec-independent protein translocase protein TatA
MNLPVMLPQIAGLGPGEIALILAVLVLLFGASKLPELARGSGRALRIFKAETKGLMDDDDDRDVRDVGATRGDSAQRAPEQREIQSGPPTLDAESERQAAERRAAEHRGDDPV